NETEENETLEIEINDDFADCDATIETPVCTASGVTYINECFAEADGELEYESGICDETVDRVVEEINLSTLTIEDLMRSGLGYSCKVIPPWAQGSTITGNLLLDMGMGDPAPSSGGGDSGGSGNYCNHVNAPATESNMANVRLNNGTYIEYNSICKDANTVTQYICPHSGASAAIEQQVTCPTGFTCNTGDSKCTNAVTYTCAESTVNGYPMVTITVSNGSTFQYPPACAEPTLLATYACPSATASAPTPSYESCQTGYSCKTGQNSCTPNTQTCTKTTTPEGQLVSVALSNGTVVNYPSQCTAEGKLKNYICSTPTASIPTPVETSCTSGKECASGNSKCTAVSTTGEDGNEDNDGNNNDKNDGEVETTGACKTTPELTIAKNNFKFSGSYLDTVSNKLRSFDLVQLNKQLYIYNTNEAKWKLIDTQELKITSVPLVSSSLGLTLSSRVTCEEGKCSGRPLLPGNIVCKKFTSTAGLIVIPGSTNGKTTTIDLPGLIRTSSKACS
ncbi:MAG: hypothetical protein Q8R15_02095, partial [Candidatus Micrarchaeota archaeon]|nr:hypothetical protein [Candidatus Micrarchaeota archaeon]